MIRQIIILTRRIIPNRKQETSARELTTMTKKVLFSATVVLACAAISFAQAPAPPAASQTPNTAASVDAPPSGTLLAVELSKSVDAKKSKANDRVEAKTATDLLAHGRIVVPRNTKIIGRVTETKPHTKDSPDSKVGITFDHMLLKDGREVPLQIAVQAIARPLQLGPGMSGNGPRADRGVPMPGQRAPMGDGSTQNVPSSYPGDLAPIPDPMSPNSPGASTSIPLNPTSKGVVGISGLSLDTSGATALLSSNSGNVHLESGTQMILRVQ
jgi:hypothetical protein